MTRRYVSRVRVKTQCRSHHRPPGAPEGGEAAGGYLDIEDWERYERQRADEQRCSAVIGELEFYGSIIDEAMHQIFMVNGPRLWWQEDRFRYCHEYTRWNAERRAAEVQWLFESEGYWQDGGENGTRALYWVPGAREICSLLQTAGWARTRSGWPTLWEKLCKTVRLGLSKGLTIGFCHRVGHETS